MENSYKYFFNDGCKYYPCHPGVKREEFNCLFCYCPMNRYEDCPGTPRYINLPNGAVLKDCMNCNFPHKASNYDAVTEFLRRKMAENYK